jgi:hypothetical protein
MTYKIKKVKERKTKVWFAFNKEGMGDVYRPFVYADTKKDAIKEAKEIYGKGASVKNSGEINLTKFKTGFK